MSRWRVLTSYLSLEPSENHQYMTQRDRRINELSRTFSKAFAPWKNKRHTDQDRIKSLTAILTGAAELGIWLFSQPGELQFRWPKKKSNMMVLAPALVKVTDERGEKLATPQIVVEAESQEVKPS